MCRCRLRLPAELGELARNFNEMAAQLKQDVEELQRQEVWRRELIMNITHDLATPLTAIAGLGEALIDGVNQSREDYEATGRVIVRETLRLHRLVRDLHAMANLEAEAIQPKRRQSVWLRLWMKYWRFLQPSLSVAVSNQLVLFPMI